KTDAVLRRRHKQRPIVEGVLEQLERLVFFIVSPRVDSFLTGFLELFFRIYLRGLLGAESFRNEQDVSPGLDHVNGMLGLRGVGVLIGTLRSSYPGNFGLWIRGHVGPARPREYLRAVAQIGR